MSEPITVSDDLLRETKANIEAEVGRQAAALEAFFQGFDLAREMAAKYMLARNVTASEFYAREIRAMDPPDLEIVSEVPYVVPRG